MSKHNKLITEMESTILNSINDGVFTVDKDWRITSFNHAAEEITGITRAEALGKQCCDVFRASICETECALRKTMATGQPISNKAIYIVDADGNRVPISISTALLQDKHNNVIGGVETFRDLSVEEELKKELAGKYTFADIISKNHEMQRLFDIIPEIATSDSTVLIQGESGTGKELVARAIHNMSLRNHKPFIAVNCGALPDMLLESELFGYKAGAFTDAKQDKPGRFALAEGGTLFLDEIGDISPALQIRLLRVLQEKTYEPLGATTSETTDVRILAATNKSLESLIEAGSFRQDLYYRINVIKIDLPALKQRPEDIPLLVNHFIQHFNHLKHKEITTVSTEVMEILINHDYPGNIRELQNIIEHVFVLCRGNIVHVQHIPSYLQPRHPAPATKPQGIRTLKTFEKQIIIETLKRNHWNRAAAAQELGIHKSTLFRKIQALNIELPNIDGRNKKLNSST